MVGLSLKRGGESERHQPQCVADYISCPSRRPGGRRGMAPKGPRAVGGGARAYFLCPGAECGRRVAVLYFRRSVFRCRHCHSLAYESQREDARRRARRRADKLRARLGLATAASPCAAKVVKPKGMWSSAFERLHANAIAAESVATAAQVAHWVRLLRRVNCRQRRAEPA